MKKRRRKLFLRKLTQDEINELNKLKNKYQDNYNFEIYKKLGNIIENIYNSRGYELRLDGYPTFSWTRFFYYKNNTLIFIVPYEPVIKNFNSNNLYFLSNVETDNFYELKASKMIEVNNPNFRDLDKSEITKLDFSAGNLWGNCNYNGMIMGNNLFDIFETKEGDKNLITPITQIDISLDPKKIIFKEFKRLIFLTFSTVNGILSDTLYKENIEPRIKQISGILSRNGFNYSDNNNFKWIDINCLENIDVDKNQQFACINGKNGIYLKTFNIEVKKKDSKYIWEINESDEKIINSKGEVLFQSKNLNNNISNLLCPYLMI